MSTLRFANGARLAASGTRSAFEAASDRCVAAGYPPITVIDGDRDYWKQVEIFVSRYVIASEVRGRKVYDRRWWNGQWWYRISAAGTVAAPSATAPHVLKKAADLAWPYNDTRTAAYRFLQSLQDDYELDDAGLGFAEAWHWERVGPINIPTGSTAGGGGKPIPPQEEDDMFDADDNARLVRIEDAVASLVRDRAASGGVQIYERTEGVPEWMIVDPTFGAHPTDPKQDGYRITLDPVEARVWARQYSGADKVPAHVTRAEYIQTQEWARGRAAQYRSDQVALISGALRSAAGGSQAVELSPS